MLAALADNGLETMSGGKLQASLLQKQMPSPLIRCALKSSDGSIWCGTDHNGLVRFLNGKAKIFTVHDGLTSNIIQTLCEDRQGRIWIGTTNGITYFDGKRFYSFTRADGLPSADVRALFFDREDNLWVGDGTQLIRFADTDLTPYTITSGSSILTILGGCVSEGGGFWCATNQGLWCVNRGTSLPYEHKSGWPSGSLRGVLPGPDHTVWVWKRDTVTTLEQFSDGPGGSADGAPLRKIVVPSPPRGQRVFDVTGDTVTMIGDDAWLEATPGRKMVSRPGKFGFVFDAQRAPDGVLWVGCDEGLFRLANDRVEKITALPAGMKVIAVDPEVSSDILFVTETEIGHYSHGVARLYGERQGLPACHPFQIRRDTSGDIWVGYEYGIYRVRAADIAALDAGSLKKLRVDNYQASDGIQSAPADTLVPGRTKDGSLWFMGSTGVTRVEPHKLTVDMRLAPVVIQDITLDGEHLTPGQFTTAPPGLGSLNIRFGALSYAAPEKICFKYRLEGFERKWTETGSRRLVTYNSLPPGQYRFQVQACNEDGVWNETGAWVSFDLQPHFYETFWFRAVIALLLIGLICLIMHYRMEQIRARNYLLETQVAKRTIELQSANKQLLEIQAELENQKDELENQNEELITMQEELAHANELLVGLASTDGLTGLKTHRTFQERLAEEWECIGRTGRPLSVILLDIDHFKHFNDTYGHPGGDEVLRGVARLLEENTRPSDIVARYGGEEMAIIAPETDASAAYILAERLRSAMEAAQWPFERVTASFGVSTSCPAMVNQTNLVADADAALYVSKVTGRNRVSHTAIVAGSPTAATDQAGFTG